MRPRWKRALRREGCRRGPMAQEPTPCRRPPRHALVRRRHRGAAATSLARGSPRAAQARSCSSSRRRRRSRQPQAGRPCAGAAPSRGPTGPGAPLPAEASCPVAYDIPSGGNCWPGGFTTENGRKVNRFGGNCMLLRIGQRIHRNPFTTPTPLLQRRERRDLEVWRDPPGSPNTKSSAARGRRAIGRGVDTGLGAMNINSSARTHACQELLESPGRSRPLALMPAWLAGSVRCSAPHGEPPALSSMAKPPPSARGEPRGGGRRVGRAGMPFTLCPCGRCAVARVVQLRVAGLLPSSPRRLGG